MPTPEWRAKHGRERLSVEARQRMNAKRRAARSAANTPEFLAAEAERKRVARAKLRAAGEGDKEDAE